MCVRILRRFHDRLGGQNNFTIYDTDDQKAVIKEVLKSLSFDSKQYPEKGCDTTYIRQQMWDSIHVHDSIYVREKNDTVRIERWHTKYIESVRRDTVYQSRVDSVPVPYPVEVKVPRELTKWQKFRLTLGTIAIGAIGVGIVSLILKIKKNSLI